MTKAKLEFDLDDFDDKAEHKRMLNATNAYIALNEVANQIFRPARKHGYSDTEISNLMKENPKSEELVGELESKFHSILEACNIDLDDLL